MNEPIVSPLTVYLIMSINTIMQIVFCIALVTVLMFGSLLCRFDFRGRPFYQQLIICFMTVLGALMVVGALLAPDRDTAIAMYLTNFVTPENLDKAKAMFDALR